MAICKQQQTLPTWLIEEAMKQTKGLKQCGAWYQKGEGQKVPKILDTHVN
jgi:hypothetical protein